MINKFKLNNRNKKNKFKLYNKLVNRFQKKINNYKNK